VVVVVVAVVVGVAVVVVVAVGIRRFEMLGLEIALGVTAVVSVILFYAWLAKCAKLVEVEVEAQDLTRRLMTYRKDWRPEGPARDPKTGRYCKRGE
jgi:hypothetical protein